MSPRQDTAIRSFSDVPPADVRAVVNAYTAGWPFCRPIDEALLAHWRTQPEFQPQHVRLVYRAGRPAAMLHGQIAGDKVAHIHLLALTEGSVDEALALLAEFEAAARAAGAERIVGPSPAAATYYGGYVLGCEPYHPHWAVEGTEAFVRGGYYISQSDTLMACDLSAAPPAEAAPAGYEIAESVLPSEFGATAFGYHALSDGQKVAFCHARNYPLLKSPRGASVGQIGPVGTNASHRGRGLARVMTLLCLARLRELGAGEAILSTGLDNVPALKAYRRAGFRPLAGMTEWSKDPRVQYESEWPITNSKL